MFENRTKIKFINVPCFFGFSDEVTGCFNIGLQWIEKSGPMAEASG
jgi:hypothetical protein